MPLPSPVIFIPGITASELADFYPLDPNDVWKLLKKDYDRIKLHPDSLKYEATQPARIVPTKAFEIPYGEMIKQLRYELSPDPKTPVPVFSFPYDWRQNLEATEALLNAFVDEVIERTSLLQHYHDEKYADNPKVSLVGHSMGGLIIAGYLDRFGTKKIGKVATMGTPFQGSHEAVARVVTGIDLLGNVVSPSRERESARVTPGLYHLLPSYPGAVQSTYAGTTDTSLFNMKNWQPSILSTLETYAKTYGLGIKKPEEIFQQMLGAAEQHRARVDAFRLDTIGSSLKTSDWLCIIGIGGETRIQTLITERDGKPSFDIDEKRDIQNGWDRKKKSKATNTGDNTVPYLGAKPRFLPDNELVCVSPHEFGFWEFKDKAINLTGLHGALPLMNMVQKLVISHLRSQPLAGLEARPAPDLKGAWKPPILGLPKAS